MTTPMKTRTVLLAALLPAMAACIRPPAVTVVDRKTALEAQAAGEYRGLVVEATQAGLGARPVPATRAELEAAGAATAQAALDQVLQVYGSLRADADVLDNLLVRRCVGEGLDGLVAETPATCKGEYDPSVGGPLVQRVNRDRRQVWQYVETQSPGRAEADVRKAWRRSRLEAVVCGGQVQVEGGAWEVKSCAE